jgi:ribosomal protein S18 acetylase RimI-like enzyme
MTRCEDFPRIRARLLRDPGWALYALGDLAPEFAQHAEWHVRADDADAVVLVYRGFSPPVLFAAGAPGAVAGILDDWGGTGEVYLHVRPEVVRAAGSRLRSNRLRSMWRMVADVRSFKPAPAGAELSRLCGRDLVALERLYDDGSDGGERPGFFAPSMLETGVYYGIYRDGDLVAAAGTHLIAPGEGVAAIGNVYTRRDCRGHGLGRMVTGAVASDLLTRIRLVGLNVDQSNGSAIRVYDALGFAIHCPYGEGKATLGPVVL